MLDFLIMGDGDVRTGRHWRSRSSLAFTIAVAADMAGELSREEQSDDSYDQHCFEACPPPLAAKAVKASMALRLLPRRCLALLQECLLLLLTRPAGVATHDAPRPAVVQRSRKAVFGERVSASRAP